MRLLLTIVSVLAFATLQAQQVAAGADRGYPQDYFRNPLDIPILLAGNFGECRPGHFHSGIDIKTAGVENKEVHAAADGYVSRIKMESGGFGHGLYITHPNGYTTLYAHLNKFAPAIQQYVAAQQYAQKRWNVDLQLTAAQFPVKKGQQIAWSGNTGASTAPHLHFEIRNTKTEHPLNPQLFGMQVADKKPPVPAEVVLYFDNPTDAGSFYENDRCAVTLEKKGDNWRPAKMEPGSTARMRGDTLLLPRGNVGIGINADDYMEGSDNTISFYTAKLLLDDSLQAMITLDNIGYDESRYINAYTDYKARQLQRKWVQCLFQLPGNHLDAIYTKLNSYKGKIRIDDTLKHKITVVLTDDRDNQTVINCYAYGSNAAKPLALYKGEPGTPFFASSANVFNQSGVSFSLDNRQLYDNINFTFRSKSDSTAHSDRYRLHEPYVPLHHYFDLQIKPTKPIPAALAGKVVLMYSDDKTEDGRGAVPGENGVYKAKVRNFGTYWLTVDTIPPAIKPLGKQGANMSKAHEIAFDVKDDKTSVRSFSGTLDGKWICFEQHSSRFFYVFDSHCPRGKHTLIFKAEDENGNEQRYTLNFTR
jgi:hypothetical protein